MQDKYTGKLFITKKNDKFLKIMKIYFLITFLCFSSVMADKSYSQIQSISADLNNVTLKEAFRELEKNSDFLFLFMDNTERDLASNVDVSLNDLSMQEILDLLLEDTNLTYSVVNRQVTISRLPGSADEGSGVESSGIKTIQQTRKTITGTVVDAFGEAIIGANIIEEGTTHGTVTDVNGRFSLDVANDATIRSEE